MLYIVNHVTKTCNTFCSQTSAFLLWFAENAKKMETTPAKQKADLMRSANLMMNKR